MRDIPLKTPRDLADFINLAERFKKRPDYLSIMLVALVARGVDLNEPVHGQTVMNRALSTQRTWLVEALLSAGADPMASTSGVPAFRAAVSWNETRAVVAMLETGRVEVNHVDGRGNLATHDAATNGNTLLLKSLLAYGGQALTPNANGETALEVFERLHVSHAMPAWQQEAADSLQELEPLARINRFEQAWARPAAVSTPKPRF